MELKWYALHVKPHKERIVYKQLQADELELFFPSVRVKPKNPRAAKIRPFFPGYLFVQLNLEEMGQNSLRWTPGVHGLVEVGGAPAVVPDKLIVELRNRLEAINIAGGLQYNELKKGDAVRVVDGPFAGYEGIFDGKLSGKDRVRVLMAFLSEHPHPIKLHIDEIQKIKPKR